MGGARGYLEQSRNCIFFFGTQSDFSRIHYLLNRLIRDFLCGVELRGCCCKMVEVMGVEQLSPSTLNVGGGLLSQPLRGPVSCSREII